MSEELPVLAGSDDVLGVATLRCAGPGCAREVPRNPRHPSEHKFCSGRCRMAAWDLENPRVRRADLGLSPASLAEKQAVRLSCGPKRKRDLDAQFKAWLVTTDGQTVYLEFVRRALSLRDAGWKHYSSDALVHAVRFDRSVRVGPDADGYRVNDHFVARLARLAMANVPELAGLFETRRLRESA